ncbi:MAG: hypothetical protein U1E46_12885 [Hyphomicrobiales bacterium]
MQLETLMLFGLGFAVAALIALFVTRALWLYALRLGRLRSLRQAPSTHADLKTEIHRLRAENAMTAVRLERRADALATRNAELIARTTRDRERIDVLSDEIERQRARPPHHEPELVAAQLRQTIEPLEQDLLDREQAIVALRQEIAARDEEIAALRDSANRFARDIAERDRVIAELRTGVKLPHEPVETLEPQAAPAGERLRMRIEELAELSRQIELQREALKIERREIAALKDAEPEAIAPMRRTDDAIEATLADARREVSAIEEELVAVDPFAAAPPDTTVPADPEPAASRVQKPKGTRQLRPMAKPESIAAIASRLRALQRDEQ